MLTLIRILSFLPLRVLYALMQGIVYPLCYYVIRYRRKVVHRNIRGSFPEKSKAECLQIEKRFYHWFCDLFAEIIYGYRISDEEIRRRVVVTNMPEIEPEIIRHGGGIVMLGHMGCWEWIADYARRWESPLIQDHVIYRRLKSDSADKAMQELRRKRGAEPLEKSMLLRHIIRNSRDEKVHIYAMLSDQKPSKNNLDCQTPFLHRMTPFITGSEVIAKKFDYPVYYIDIQMPKRGHYIVTAVPITTDPANSEEGYITRQFARSLEQNIIKQPEIWLWSHNRFKFSTPLND